MAATGKEERVGDGAAKDTVATAAVTAAAAEQVEEAADGAGQAAAEAHEVAAHLEEQAEALLEAVESDELLEGKVRAEVAGVDEQHPFGQPGRPFSSRSPFRWAFSAAIGALAAYELLKAVVAVRQVLVLVLIAAFLAVGLDPAVSWLARRMRRGLAVAVVMLAVLGFFGGFVAAAAPPVAHQVTQLVHKAPTYVADLQRNRTLASLDRRYHLLGKLRTQADKLPTAGINAAGGALGIGKAVLGALASLLTIIVLTLYFLANLPPIKRVAYRLVPRTRRARASLLTDEVFTRVGGYVLGNLATSVVAGVTAALFMLIAGVPYPVALALLIAITDLVPLIGASIGAIVVTLVAFLAAGLPAGIGAIVFFVCYQQFENYVLVPRVMKRTVDVSPLATILAALIGAGLLGIVGALLAIPAAAAVQLVLREVVLPRQEDA